MNKLDSYGIGYKLIDATTGADVNVGDKVFSFRGEPAVIVDASPPHKPSSTGKVIVVNMPEEGTSEYYPGVFNLKWVMA